MRMSEFLLYVTLIAAAASAVLALSSCSLSDASVSDASAHVAAEGTCTYENNLHDSEITANPTETDFPEASPSAAPYSSPASPTASAAPLEDTLVRISDYIPDIIIELKYAGNDNFTGKKIYDFTEAYARYGTVVKLKKAQEIFREKGLCLKVWDAFRPASAQRRLWEIYPDGDYVSNPNIGYSNHTRGSALDVTLTNASGGEIEMPTEFDDFTEAADRDYSDVSDTAAENARLLENVMESCGFTGYSAEWWHFNDTVKYDPELEFTPE